MAQGGGWGQILAAGVNGYLTGQGIVASQKKSETEQAYLDEKRTRQRQEWADEDGLKSELRAAVAPVAVVQGANGLTLPPEMDNRDVGMAENAALPNAGLVPGVRVGGTAYDAPVAAQAAAAQANLPESVAARQAAVYSARGMPEKAALLEQRQAALQKQALEWKEKGILDGVRQFRQGNKDGAMAALKKSGMFNPEGEVSMEPEEVDIPGMGKVKSYTATFQNKGEDGKLTPVRLNSHELSLATMPYEKQLDLMGKNVDREDKMTERKDRALDRAADNKRADLLAGGMMALRAAQTNRTEHLAAGGGGSGRGGSSGASGSKQDRLVVQNLLGNVKSEIREIDAGLKEEQKNLLPGDPPTPRMKDLVAQRSQLEQKRAGLNSEMESIPRSTTGASAAKEQAPLKTEKTSRGDLPKIATKADYDKLAKGARYVAPDGSQRVKQ